MLITKRRGKPKGGGETALPPPPLSVKGTKKGGNAYVPPNGKKYAFFR